MLTSSFRVLHFTFRSVIHFELIFVKGVRFVLRFIFYMWMSGCSSITVLVYFLVAFLLQFLAFAVLCVVLTGVTMFF